MLYFILLQYVVLYNRVVYIILHLPCYTILCTMILQYIILYDATVCSIQLPCTLAYCMIPYYSVLHDYTVLYRSTPCSTILNPGKSYRKPRSSPRLCRGFRGLPGWHPSASSLFHSVGIEEVSLCEVLMKAMTTFGTEEG